MRVVFLLGVPSILLGQIFSFGVKGGLPISPVSDAGPCCLGRAFAGTTDFQLNRYTFGPTVVAKLPWTLRLEVDVLYKHARNDAYGGPSPTGFFTYQTSHTNVWEIPMLLNHHFGDRAFTPYAALGGSLRYIGPTQGTLLAVPEFPGFSSSTTNFNTPSDPSLMSGITAAGGISIRTRFLRFEPELQYTHWTSKHELETKEQFEFLLGITFR